MSYSAFSNSSSSTTENGRSRTEDTSAAARGCVARSPSSRSRLSHVWNSVMSSRDEAFLRAEEVFGKGLGELRLAGAGGADEEEDAERAGRIREARLDHRDALDEALDRLRLTENPPLEELLHRAEIERRPVVQDVERQPGRGGEPADHVLGLHLVGATLLGAASRCSGEPDDVPR